jgi:hypothetical protein
MSRCDGRGNVIKSGYYSEVLLVRFLFPGKRPMVEKEKWRRQSSDDEGISNRSFAIGMNRVDLNFTNFR